MLYHRCVGKERFQSETERRSRFVGLEPVPWYRVYTRAMKIGELSKATGVKVGTIRFYERKKLLRPACRTPSGYRSYSEQDVNSVKGIRLTQDLGFTLKEIKELLDLHRTVTRLPDPIVNRNGMRHAMAMTEEKLHVLDQKVRQLRRMRRDVAQMLLALQKAAGNACPFLNRTPSPKQD
jgi:DNA-binding transcriptional MerR regulator